MAYLLPCPQCGRKLVVTTGEAGGQTRCECGATVEVPTVRGLRDLEQAPIPAGEAATPWTTRHSVVFLGVLVAVVGLGFGVFLHFRAEAVLPKTAFADDIRTMPPAETWELWSNFFREGVGNWQPKKDAQQLAAINRYHELKRWQLIGFGLAGVGVVVAIVGFTMLGPKRSTPPKRPPRRPTTTAGRK